MCAWFPLVFCAVGALSDYPKELEGVLHGAAWAWYVQETGVFNPRIKIYVWYEDIDGDVEELLADAPWYALPIVQQECGYTPERGYRQFNTTGNLGTNIQGVVENDYQWCPNRSSDGIGWGLMQLTNPRPTAQQLWDWRANVQGGLDHLTNTCRDYAERWIARQETRQQAQDPSQPLDNEIFTFGGMTCRKGTAFSPVDACTISRYNGSSPVVISWQEPTNGIPGAWVVNEGKRAYVDAICAKYAGGGP